MEKLKKPKPFWLLLVETVVVSFIAAFLLRFFIVDAYNVVSGSMEGSLLTGDLIFFNKLAYLSGAPKRGDVIVFKFPLDPSKRYIKRVVGLPGDTLKIVDKVVFINSKILPEPPLFQRIDARIYSIEEEPRDNMGPIVVPKNQYFVMGDNRDNSYDSRYWGCVPKAKVIGKTSMIYWSRDKNIPWYNPAGWRVSRIFASPL
ncbi:MAG: signal peptidase I [Patescibacteria group bacterium]